MATDEYPNSESIISPSDSWAALTPHDSTDFTFTPKAIKVGDTAGSFVAVGQDDVTAPFYANAGELIPIRPKRINTTGLTGGMTFVGLK